MSQDLAKINQMPITEVMSIATAFAESGMFPDTKHAAQAVVKIQAGQEIGIPPFAAMTGIHIIKGRPTIGAGLIASRVKGSGKYDYEVVESSDTKCSINFFQGKKMIGNSTFTIEDARRAGTQNIDKFPKNMLFARAISNGVKFFCPDVFAGPVYVPEEVQDTVDVAHEVVPPTPPAPDPAKLETARAALQVVPQTAPQTEEEYLELWRGRLQDCKNEEDLGMLFRNNRAELEKAPKVVELFAARKLEVTPEAVAA